MNSSERPRQTWQLCGTILLLAICLYVSFYVLMVNRVLNGVYNVKDATYRSPVPPHQLVSNRPPKGAYPMFRAQYCNLFGKEAYFKSFFSPLHRLDRSIRRSYWEDE